MRTLQESIIGRKGASSTSGFNRKKAIEYAKDYIAESSDYEEDDIYDQYESAGNALYYLCGCSDKEVAEIANTALDDEDTDDVYDRLEIYLDAISKISRLK